VDVVAYEGLPSDRDRLWDDGTGTGAGVGVGAARDDIACDDDGAALRGSEFLLGVWGCDGV
jgi:hypothetical protein